MKKIVGNDNIDINRTISNLELIISKSKDVLIPDTNVLIPGNNFLFDTYHTTNYSCLNIKNLEYMQKCIKIGFLLLEHPNIYITLNVLNEVKYFSDIISERTRHYNKSMKSLIKNHRTSSNTEEKASLYIEIGKLTFDLFRTAKCVYKSNGAGDYSNMLGIVLGLSKNLGLKGDESPRELLEPRINRCEHKSYDTDEEIVALALYLSINKNESCTILSEDRDVIRILKYSSEFLKSEDLSDKRFSSSLAKYPITIYNPIVEKISNSNPVFSTGEMDNQKITGLSMNRKEIIDYAEGDYSATKNAM